MTVVCVFLSLFAKKPVCSRKSASIIHLPRHSLVADRVIISYKNSRMCNGPLYDRQESAKLFPPNTNKKRQSKCSCKNVSSLPRLTIESSTERMMIPWWERHEPWRKCSHIVWLVKMPDNYQRSVVFLRPIQETNNSFVSSALVCSTNVWKKDLQNNSIPFASSWNGVQCSRLQIMKSSFNANLSPFAMRAST